MGAQAQHKHEVIAKRTSGIVPSDHAKLPDKQRKSWPLRKGREGKRAAARSRVSQPVKTQGTGLESKVSETEGAGDVPRARCPQALEPQR